MNKPEDDVVGEMAERFYVIYDGWALEHHLMDVRDLAPAMIAVNDLLSNANKALNGDKADLNLFLHNESKEFIKYFKIHIFFLLRKYKVNL